MSTSAYVQLNADGTGKKVGTIEVTREADGNTVEIQLVALADVVTGAPLQTEDGRLDVDNGQGYSRIRYTDTNNSNVYFDNETANSSIFISKSAW